MGRLGAVEIHSKMVRLKIKANKFTSIQYSPTYLAKPWRLIVPRLSLSLAFRDEAPLFFYLGGANIFIGKNF